MYVWLMTDEEWESYYVLGHLRALFKYWTAAVLIYKSSTERERDELQVSSKKNTIRLIL